MERANTRRVTTGNVVGSESSRHTPHLLSKRPGELSPVWKHTWKFQSFGKLAEKEEKVREPGLTNHYHHYSFNLRAMGSQQAWYKQTPQSCLELRTVGCHWKRRGDWTKLSYLKTLLQVKRLQFRSFWKLHKRLSMWHQAKFFANFLVNRLHMHVKNGRFSCY